MAGNRIEFYIQKGEGMNGVKSHRVRALQEMLFYLEWLIHAPDGQFGPNTEAAVKKAQKILGFDDTGIVDVAFFQALAAECIYLNPKERG